MVLIYRVWVMIEFIHSVKVETHLLTNRAQKKKRFMIFQRSDERQFCFLVIYLLWIMSKYEAILKIIKVKGLMHLKF